MIERRSIAAAAGALHAAHCARRTRHQGALALAPVASTTLLGADRPHDDSDHRPTIR